MVEGLFPELELFVVLRWIPEQAEDVFHVLVSRNMIVEIDVPRDGSEPSLVKVHNVHAYARRRLSKPDRRKLEAALTEARDFG